MRRTPLGNRFALTVLFSLVIGSLFTAQSQTHIDPLNATYEGIYDEPIELSEGEYVGPRFDPDIPERPRVDLLPEVTLRGDLTADGVDEVVAFLVENSGGSFSYLYAAVLASVDGAVENVATTAISGLTSIRGARIEDGRVVLDLLVAGPADTTAFRFDKERNVLELQGSELVVVQEQNEGRLSIADIGASGWRLQELALGVPTLGDTEITLEYRDARFVGIGGCNRYQVDVSPDPDAAAPNRFTLGPLYSTRSYCDPIVTAHEDEFLAKLAGAYEFYFDQGRLWMSYRVSDRRGQLTFEPLGDGN